mmetsp:Transcript_95862/g.254645  ORF Transcript_95862/g.254645 Transcript_95862/m.254645 type:complete len:372 (-) Transcript_95862:32-1147(-)
MTVRMESRPSWPRLRHLALLAAWVRCLEAAPARQPFALEIPKVTHAQLAANATLRSGLHAYVLKGHVKSQWKAANWTLDYLAKKIPFEWVDFYDKNMVDMGSKPFLFKFKEALPRFEQKTGIPRYMQLRLSLRGWKRLRKDFQPLPDPEIFWSDEEWIGKCMRKNDKPDVLAIDNFYTTVQWKFLLIGEEGTTMFLHQDGTASSSWQAQLKGRKKWTLCPNTESRFLDTRIDTFSERDATHSTFAKAYCGQVIAEEGDLLYYPGYWWHHTLQLETPSVAYTGALVGTESQRDDIGRDRRAHAAFLRDMEGKCAKCWKKGDPERKCDDISLRWPGAAPPMLRVLCDHYFPECFKLWDKHARSLGKAVRGDEL